MKKLLIVILALTVMASFCYAKEKMTPTTQAKATTPVGGVVEMGAVFVGRIVDVVDDSMKGKSVKVSDDKGKIRIYPVDQTVKIVDTSFNALTLNQLKKGEKVKVETSGAEKTITVTK